MRFSSQTLIALLASPLLALGASTENPFNIPATGLTASAGKTLDLTWNPTTQGTVTLLLRSGANNDLTSGTVIAKSIQNDGSYSWSIPSDITRGSDYAIEIVDDADNSKTNYTPQFIIDSTNTVASSTSYISGSSSASASGSSSASASRSSSASASASASSSASASASSSSASASASGSSSSASASMSSSASASRSMTTSASGSSTRASSTSSAPTSTGMAAASAIPLGLLALGALAL